MPQALPLSQPTPRRSSEDRQREIVLAVLALAEARGVEAVTTQAIAQHMGLTQGAVFRHFPNKEAIFAAVLDWLNDRLEEVFRAEPGVTPLARLERGFAAYMALFAAHPAVPRLFFSDTLHHPYPRLHARLQEMVQGCERQIAEWLAEAVVQGEVRTDLPPAVAAKLLLSGIQGLAFQTCVLGIVSDPVAAGRQLFPLYLAALGAAGE
ncbi:MAG: TetR/AcrR family transcriptional regulator [Thiobacillaceae bacterium]